MIKRAALILVLFPFLPSCSTVLYDGTGKPLAKIQSDATNVAYTKSADGSVSFTAATLSNSGPVLAAGKALTPAIMALSTAAALSQTTNIVNAVRKPIP